MSPEEIQSRLTKVMRDVFDDESLIATPELTADQVDEWDSLNHVRFLLTVEREFSVKFAAFEVSSLKNVGDLSKLIGARS